MFIGWLFLPLFVVAASAMSTKEGGFAAKLARPNILELLPYRCARDDYNSGIALLDANENAYGSPLPPPPELHRYPDPYQTELKTKVSAYRKVTNDNIFVGVGSDEAIDLLLRIFCVPGKECILTTPPTYGMYKVCAKVNDVEVVTVPLTETFDLQVDQMIQTAQQDARIKLIFVCSPGNPTCKAIPKADIRKLANACTNALIVVDEAYVDFCPNASAMGFVHSADNQDEVLPNVCVLQTLSKAFGMAAVRCGFLFGAKDVIRLMNNVKAPYNVNALTSRAAISAFDRLDAVHSNVQNLIAQRSIVMDALKALPFVEKVFPSDANFILFRLNKEHNAEQVYKQMADQGIVTRFRGNEPHCSNCIRVTVGTETENEAFLAMLKDTVK